MKRFLLSLLVTVFAFGIAADDAEARRLGGGGSFGMKRQIAPKPAPRKPAAAPTNPAGAGKPAATPQRSWMGPVAGLAAGLGLAALFSHLGLGEELATMVMLLLLVAGAVLVFRMLTRRRQLQSPPSGMHYAADAHGGSQDFGRPQPFPAAPPATARAADSAHAATSAFDAAAFAREAKVNFIRLQAANDAGNLDDLRQFTTPEVFAELSLQFSERGPGEQRTDIIELDAEVIAVEEEDERYIVSVRFQGVLREGRDSEPGRFAEIWHLTKSVSGNDGWRIAGIQQLH